MASGSNQPSLCLLFVAIIFSVTLRCSSRAAYRSLDIPVFPLHDLEVKNPEALGRLHDAVISFGLLAVQPSSSQSLAQAAALRSFVDCTNHGHLDGLTNTVLLSDGTIRKTFATATNKGQPDAFPESVTQKCAEFSLEANMLRETVNRIGVAYASALDRMVHGQTVPPSSDSYASAINTSDSLEHFHVFNHRPDISDSLSNGFKTHHTLKDPRLSHASTSMTAMEANPTLEMHSDIGLFIVMTQATYFSSSSAGIEASIGASGNKPESGLYLQLPSGEVVKPTVPDGCLLVMNGEGASRWMRASQGAVQLRATLHEVQMPELLADQTRVWYGRMFFPPSSNTLQLIESDPRDDSLGNITFGEYRLQAEASFKSDSSSGEAATTSLGCGSIRRKVLQDNGSCNATNQLFCWMSCVTLDPSLYNCPTSEVLCRDTSSSKIWPQDFPSHCFTCLPSCPALPPPVGVPDTNDNGTSTLAGPSHPPPPYPGTVFPAWDNKPLTLGILLFPGFELLDVTGPLQWVGFKEIMRVSFVSKDGKGVTATQNVTAKVQYSFKTAPVFDVILVPGGGGTYAALNDTDLIQWIKKTSNSAKFTWSVCTGAWLLAKANLLDGRSATTNKYYWGKTANYPLVDWKPSARWVVDGKYWTSSGVSAGMDMAISFVSAYFGKELAKMSYQVAEYIPNLDPWNDPFAINGTTNKMIRAMFGSASRRRHLSSHHRKLSSSVGASASAVAESPSLAAPPPVGTTFPPWDSKALTMGLLLFPGYETLDATGPLQMLSYWDFVQVSIVTKHGKGVASKQNLTLQAKFSFKTAPKFDILFVPGGDVLNVINDKATINYIRKADRHTRFTWSVCNGAWVLAKAGVLNGRSATTNKFYWGNTQKWPKVNWQPSARWVTDGKYWTASGVAAGLDMSLGFTSDYFGSLFAQMNYLLFEYTPNLDPRNDSYAIGSPLNKQIRAEFGTYRHRRF